MVLTRLLTKMVYGVTTTDPATFVGNCGVAESGGVAGVPDTGAAGDKSRSADSAQV